MKSLLGQLDRSVPAFVFKLANYPLHHGSLGVVRSLGRVGIPVYANQEDIFTPVARSRYLKNCTVWAANPNDPEAVLVRLDRLSDSVGKQLLMIPTDDEAALFVAEHIERLDERFLVTKTEPSVVRSVADKVALSSMCSRLQMPTVRFSVPKTEEDLIEFLETVRLPVVLKAAHPALIRTSSERSTSLVHNTQQALDLFRNNIHLRRGELFLQEYIRDGQDWFFHGYSDANSKLLAGFAGVKLRSYPPYAGPTAFGQWVHNDELVELVQETLKAIQYRGICDLDLRLDFRDNKFKLLDFNPRVGAQFRLFEDNNGIDVVRALHLDLTGRAVPACRPRFGRTFMVETVDPVAVRGYRQRGQIRTTNWLSNARGTKEWAWCARDDPMPVVAATSRLALRRMKRTLLKRRSWSAARKVDRAAYPAPTETGRSRVRVR